jgi:hypothetical protein
VPCLLKAWHESKAGELRDETFIAPGKSANRTTGFRGRFHFCGVEV